MTTITDPQGDTIAAVATAAGTGGVGIIRLSGPRARHIAETICGRKLKPRYAHYCRFRSADDDVLDSGITLYFPAPNSFTGEEVTELQAHGGPVILDLLMARCCELGARSAQPGEFSRRAYLNNRMDLAQAEAIADLISSTTARGAINASRSLQGEFSRRINQLVEAITRLRVEVEAAIDFPEEEIDFLNDGNIAAALARCVQQLDDVLSSARQGAIIREGLKLVIAGKPNAGKSSLLNQLAGHERAIVTDIAGTTRDVLREHIQLDGMPLHIVDTAGLREATDAVEQEGIRRATAEMESADRILLLIDGRESNAHDATFSAILGSESAYLPEHVPITVIRNKCDLTDTTPFIEDNSDPMVIHLSAKSGDGMHLLKKHLKQCAGLSTNNEGTFSARRRHLLALDRANEFLLAGQAQLTDQGAGELLAEDLRHAQLALGEITGEVSADDLLGEIFSSFCIGK